MPILTDEQVAAFEELQRRGSLSPEQEAAFTELRRRRMESPEVRIPQGATGFSSGEAIRGLTELGGMMIGGPIGGKIATTAARYVLPSMIKGISAAGRLAGSSLGGGAGAVTGDVIAPTDLTLGVPDLRSSFLRGSAEGLAGEGLGQIGTALATKIASPLARSMTPEAPIAERMLAGRVSPPLLPAEATQSRALDILHNVAEHSAFGGNKMVLYKANRQAVMKDLENEIINSFGQRATPEQVGEVFQAAVSKNLELARAPAKAIYRNLEPMLTTVQMPTTNLKSFASPLMEQAKRLQGIEGQNAGDELVKSITTLPENLSYVEAKNLRTRIQSGIDTLQLTNKKAPAIGVAKKMVQQLTADLGEAIQRVNPSAKDLWDEANRIYREGSQEFNNKLIRGLVRRSSVEAGGIPESVYRSTFSGENVSRIDAVQKAVGGKESETWKLFQSAHAQDIIASSTVGGELRGSLMLTRLLGKGEAKANAAGLTFTAEQLTAMKEFAQTVKLIQERQATGQGGMLVQLVQGGALVHLATGGPKMLDIPLLLGPEAISRIMLSPMGAKWLSTGLTVNRGTSEAIKLSGRLAAITGGHLSSAQAAGGAEAIRPPQPAGQNPMPPQFESWLSTRSPASQRAIRQNMKSMMPDEQRAYATSLTHP